MTRNPRKPSKNLAKKKVARSPVARGEAALKRKAGPLAPKKGKGTPYHRSEGKSFDGHDD
jgi:hypothetical protein